MFGRTVGDGGLTSSTPPRSVGGVWLVELTLRCVCVFDFRQPVERTIDLREDVIAMRSLFWEEMARIVLEMTDYKSLPKAERKRLQIEHAHHMSREAALVKLADKICNLRDVAANSPAEWGIERRIEYFDWAKAVVDGLLQVSVQLCALFDAAYAAKPRSKTPKVSGSSEEVSMALELWIGGGGYFFLDTSIAGGVKVGQAWPQKQGWKLEVNDDYLDVVDLEDAKRTFLRLYNRAKVTISPGTSSEEPLDTEGFQIIQLASDRETRRKRMTQGSNPAEISDAAREKRLRKLVQKRGYALKKNRSRTREHPGYGKFMIVDRNINAPVAGHTPSLFSYDLDQVDAWLAQHGKE